MLRKNITMPAPPNMRRVLRHKAGDPMYAPCRGVVQPPKAPTSRKLRKVVQKIVKGQAETKYVSNALTVPNSSISNLGSFVGFSTAITGTGEIYGCLPMTYQGTDDHNRVGNKIQPTSCKIKLDITTKDHVDNSSLDRTVHVFVLSSRSVKSLDNYSAIPITLLMDKGDGSQTSFDGTTFNGQLPVNSKEFTVHHHRQMRMVSGFGKANATTAATAGSTDGVISPSHSYARLTLKIPVPKTLIYDRSSSTYPVNCAPFLVIGFTKNDNDGQAHVAMDYVSVLGQVQMYYKDS